MKNIHSFIVKRFVTTFVWLVLLLPMTFAAYLKNVPQTLVQPNGDTLHCFATGDEFYHRLHDANGYTIILDKSTGYYVYADKAGDQLVPTSYIAGRTNPVEAGLTPNLSISAAQWRERRRMWESAVPASNRSQTRSGDWNHGHINNIVIFIRFADDAPFVNNFSDVEAMFNESTSGYNSMYNYFKAATYDQLTITSTFYPTQSGTTILSYQDTYNRSYFEPYSDINQEGYSADERLPRENALLARAVNAVASQIPTNLDLDNNSDGCVDNVCFVVRGNVGEWNDLLWPHRTQMYYSTARINGKRVRDYNFQLADATSYFTPSVLCHEMNHSLGAPDLYHYDDNYRDLESVSVWDLMHQNTNPPQHMGAYMKYHYGNWISDIPEITECGTYSIRSLGSSATNNCYKIASPNSNEFFVLEYRNTNDPFEGTLPSSGLLVYRINTDFRGNANYDGETVFDEVYLYRPNGTFYDNGNIYWAAFSQESGRTEMNANTNPYPFLTDGTIVPVGDFTLRNISSAGGDVMTFTVCQSGSQTQVPTVTTNTVSSIAATSATCGGNVTSNGGASVTARGVCWSTSPNPTVSNSHTTDGTGTGSFTSSITGLSPNTTYYVRAYATNSEGTGYGSQRSFTTSTASGTLVDYQLWGFVDNTTDQNFISEIDLGTEDDLLTHIVLGNNGPDVPNANDVIYLDVSIDGEYWGSMSLYGSQLSGLTSGYYTFINSTIFTASDMDDYGFQGSFELCITIRIDGVAVDPVSDNNTICITVNRGSSDSPVVDYELWGFIDNTTDQNFISEINLDTEDDLYTHIVLANNGPDIPNANDVIYIDIYVDGEYWGYQYLMGSQLSGLTAGNAGILSSTIFTASAMDEYGIQGSFELCISVRIEGDAIDPYSENNTVCITVNRIGLPAITTLPVTDITSTTATCGGNITSNGGTEITARGVCWSLSQYPTIADAHTTDGTDTGSFTSNLTGLTPNTSYFVRAYATNSEGTAYGTQWTFTTSCNTVDILIKGDTNVCKGESTTLTASGAVSYLWESDGENASITVTPTATTTYNVTGTDAYGCSASASITVTVHEIPTLTISGDSIFCQAETTTLTATGTDSYRWDTGDETASITVTPSVTTTYTVTGTSQYGCSATASITVTITALMPAVTTEEVSNISSTSATCGGEVLCAGAAEVTERGVCWGTEQNPTIADSHTTDGTGTGSFTSNLTDLTPNTTYFVRAYATNSEGTAYGAQKSFTTECNTVTVTINGNTDVCKGESTTLTASGAVSYLWETSDETASITVTPTATTTYALSATNQYDCSSTYNVTVTVHELPLVTIRGDRDICEGGSTTLTAAGAETYEWNTTDSVTVITVAEAGTYMVTGIDSNGCQNIATFTVIVHTHGTGNIEETICENDLPYHYINGNIDTTFDVGTPNLSSFDFQLISPFGCDSTVTLTLTITPCDTTGIHNAEESGLYLFPNPTNDIVNLQLNPETCKLKPEIQLFDIYGRKLQVMPVTSERTQIDLSRYATGVYIVKLVNNGNVTAVRKVVKQ